METPVIILDHINQAVVVGQVSAGADDQLAEILTPQEGVSTGGGRPLAS